MSDTSDAQARSGIGIGTLVRLLAIALGIMSAVLMARDGFKIRLSDYLDAILTVYDDALTTIAIIVFEPAVQAAFATLREWFAVDLKLFGHWKHAFVLLSLIFGSLARSRGGPYHWHKLFLQSWGAACAFVGGVLAGTAPLGSASVLLWPASLLAVYAAGRHAFAVYGMNIAAPRNFVEWVMISGAIAGPIALALLPLPTSSPGLLVLIPVVAVVGISCMFYAFVFGGGYVDAWFHMGLDIVAVLGGAAFIVWLGNALA